jgi:hypothetical protein
VLSFSTVSPFHLIDLPPHTHSHTHTHTHTHTHKPHVSRQIQALQSELSLQRTVAADLTATIDTMTKEREKDDAARKRDEESIQKLKAVLIKVCVCVCGVCGVVWCGVAWWCG